MQFVYQRFEDRANLTAFYRVVQFKTIISTNSANPAGTYLLNFNCRNTRARCENC